jgi:hypothetical protein
MSSEAGLATEFKIKESIPVDTQCHRYYLALEAMERISHGDTVTGIDNATNTRLFMRHAMKVNGIPMRVPDVSENAIRSVMIRRPLHDHMLKVLDVGAGDLPQSVMNLLYSGGNLKGNAKSPEAAMDLAHKIRKLYPSLWLLGGATDNFVLTRSALRVTAWPVTQEFRRAMERFRPDLLEEADSSSIFDYLFEETRVRGTGAESSGNQTLYTYEVVAAGLKILLELTLDPWIPDPVFGCMFASPQLWDGFFGGQGRQGAGRMAFDWLANARGEDNSRSPLSYTDHLQKHGEEMRTGLLNGTLGTGREICA